MRSLATPRRRAASNRRITLGAGEHGVAVALGADAALDVLGATVADVSEPEAVAP